ncbi:MAG: hypothetical protein IPK60_23915 [Sandaracinaceae bacterium]|nr:hypothetical protein [Sandaracinaceae bacterium]
MTQARFALATLALLASTLGPVAAHAQDPGELGVWADANTQALQRRLISELRVRGYATHAIDDASALEGLGAAVWIRGAPLRARLCTLRTTPHCEELLESDAAVLLIRVVETVRAQLGEPGAIAADEERRRAPSVVAPQLSEGEQPGQVDLDASTSAPPTQQSSSPLALSLHASLPLPVRGLSTGLNAELLLEWNLGDTVGLEVGGATSLLSPEVGDATGSASVSSSLVWVGAHVRFLEGALGGHAFLLGLGVGVGSAEIRASAAAPFQERSTSEFFALAVARLALTLRVSDRVAIEPGVVVGVALPAPVLVFAEREVAHVFAPLIAPSIGVRLAF